MAIDRHPIFDQSTRMAISDVEAIKSLPLDRAEQAWGGTLPGQIVFWAQIGDSAIFVTEDWGVTIRSRRLIDCVGGMCTILSVLGQEFSSPIAVELSDVDAPNINSLYDDLDREQRVQRYLEIRNSLSDRVGMACRDCQCNLFLSLDTLRRAPGYGYCCQDTHYGSGTRDS